MARTVAHFFPEMNAWLDGLHDPRDPNRITYPARCLTWAGLLVFLLKLGSRRQIRFELDSPTALENLNRLAGCRQDRVPHGDTLNYFVGRLAPGEFHSLRRCMVNRLIRMKVLDGDRLLGRFLVVIDGTGQLTFRHRHCPHCLERTAGGQTLYYHHVLEAKLVTPDGLAISIGTEFIVNDDPKATQQDCESKAFRRLTAELSTATWPITMRHFLPRVSPRTMRTWCDRGPARFSIWRRPNVSARSRRRRCRGPSRGFAPATMKVRSRPATTISEPSSSFRGGCGAMAGHARTCWRT